jgi:type VI secretion system secreted protein Hcp
VRNAFAKSSVSLAFVVLLVCSTLAIAAGLPAYMTVKGQSQGDIKGEVSQKGREGTIRVLAFSHEVISPRDAASGLPTGKRQHKALIITKEIDKSTPQLMQALVNNENLPTLTLKFYRPSSTGMEDQYYTIKLTNAAISGIKQYMAYSEGTGLTGKHLEEVSFTYQKIEWIITDGGISAMDDWESPIA